jgi:hypothetical protein
MGKRTMAARRQWTRIPLAEAERIMADARANDPVWPSPPSPVWQWYTDADAQDAHDPRDGAIEEYRRYGDPVCRLRRVHRHGAWDYERSALDGEES